MRTDKDREIKIMGIVNLTDDSYFADSRCYDAASAVKRIGEMIDAGADIIDLGACSTRPGSIPVGEKEEWRRLSSVLPIIKDAYPDIAISVDTCWSSVVEKVYGLIGSFIVNDISSGEDDPAMLSTVGRLGLDYIAMHKRGNPQTMQDLTDYEDVVEAVVRYFQDFACKAREAGIGKWVLDPGFGFAKTIEQNYRLLSELNRFKDEYLGYSPQVLVGISRKSMIYKPLGILPENALAATQVAHLVALQNGADILRVHDVSEARQTIDLYRMIFQS